MSENNLSNIQSEDYTDFRPLYESRYGYSRIFTAKNKGKKVIIKALKEQNANDPKCRAILHEEYDITSMLDNKFIRKALDFVNIQGLGDCIVFEYIEGKSLAEHVRVGTLSEKQVKNILVDTCDALAYLNRNQLVHCNLKPENIIVTESDHRAKLIDIGIPVTDQETDRELLIKEMEFVAPEIIKGEDYDSRADIYSLGKIMEFISQRNISKQYNAVATHCTQFSKEQRYDTISEVKSAITKGHSVVKIIIATIVVAVIAVLAFIYVPKIKNNVAVEKERRQAFEFEQKKESIKKELPSLCEKYQLKSLSEPITVNWTDDSLRFIQTLLPFFGKEEYKKQAMILLENQRIQIEKHRMADFDTLLLNEFKQATDSAAIRMRNALPEQTDEILLREAEKWYNQDQ